MRAMRAEQFAGYDGKTSSHRKNCIWKMKSGARWTLEELWGRVRLSATF